MVQLTSREGRHRRARGSACRSLVLLASAAAAALALATVAAAAPGNGAVRVPVLGGPIDLSAAYCGFPIHVAIVSNNEYYIHLTTLPNGTLIARVTGSVVETFTNEETGKSVTVNVSGPGTTTYYPDGSILF